MLLDGGGDTRAPGTGADGADCQDLPVATDQCDHLGCGELHDLGMRGVLPHGDDQPFSAPAVSPSVSNRSLAKKMTTMGRVKITEPAISTVVGISMLPAS